MARSTILALIFKLVESASKKWRRLAGLERLAEVIDGIPFIDGRKQVSQTEEDVSELHGEEMQVAT